MKASDMLLRLMLNELQRRDNSKIEDVDDSLTHWGQAEEQTCRVTAIDGDKFEIRVKRL